MTVGRSRARLGRVVTVVAVLAVALVLVARGPSQQSHPSAASIQPSAWELPRLGASGTLRLSDLHGHPVVLDFFASWCTACRGELPGMASLSRRLEGRVTFAGVDSQENGDGIGMARQYGVAWWPLARDTGGTQDSGLHDVLGARGMPLTAFYDANGRLLTVVYGAVSEDDLRSRIQALFGVTA